MPFNTLTDIFKNLLYTLQVELSAYALLQIFPTISLHNDELIWIFLWLKSMFFLKNEILDVFSLRHKLFSTSTYMYSKATSIFFEKNEILDVFSLRHKLF